MSNEIVIYTISGCPYCKKAKELLEMKHLSFKEVDVGSDPSLRTEVFDRTGGATSVPQIFLYDTYVGGYDNLQSMNNSGELDNILSQYGSI